MEAAKFVRIAKLAKRLGISEPTVRDWVKRGHFPAPVRVGSRFVAWREADVVEWERKKLEAANPAPAKVPRQTPAVAKAAPPAHVSRSVPISEGVERVKVEAFKALSIFALALSAAGRRADANHAYRLRDTVLAM